MTTENKSKNEMIETSLPGSENAGTKMNEVVICDECGDSLWDAVLAQDEKASAIHPVCKSPLTDLLMSQTKK